MDIQTINTLLSQGNITQPGLFPHVEQLKNVPFIFKVDFGLEELPTDPGILLIRGARQYGKSTWLEGQIKKTIQNFGAGAAFYLNGESIANVEQLEQEIEALSGAFSKHAAVRRLFIDEITAIPHWEMALKKMADRGKLAKILVITTGSKTTDLRRGVEKLPGRKGRLSRTTYLFTPVSYKEFHRVCNTALAQDTLAAYLISGDSPIACTELASQGRAPDFAVELTRDWIEGEIAASGRMRASLFNILHTLFRFGSSPIGQAKLAREAGLSNNTVAAGYMELLNDLGCVVPAYPWDPSRKILLLRKQCKYHFTNLLAAVAYHPARIRSPGDFKLLSEKEQGMWYEWLVAQELVRRAALRHSEILAPLAFWQENDHELDFMISPDEWLEVKRGRCSAFEFRWFPPRFPHSRLKIINSLHFEADHIQGVSLENFLLGD